MGFRFTGLVTASLAPIVAFGLATVATLAACTSCDKKDVPPPAPDAGSVAEPASKSSRLDDAGSDAGAPATAARLTDAPWNVLLLTVDSLRADMPWAGYERPIAPRLTAFAAQSIAYTHAYSTSSFTSKSIPGLLTGRYPSELARTGAFFTRYLDAKDFFCTSLRGADGGVPCVGGHAHAYFGPQQGGFERGFEDWRLVSGITFDYQTDPYVTSDKLTPLAESILQAVSAKNRPFFAWFHYMDPHDEYKPHEESPHFGKRPRDLYDEEVFFTDLWVGKLLDWVDAQPWAARTVVVLTADHGEAFGEHGMSRHAHELWDELVHVPLFFRIPGRPARVIDQPRGAADLAPTFIDLLGAKLDPPPHFAGTSLAAELGDAALAPPARDVIVDLPEDEYNERRRALIHGSTKLIAFGADVRFSLFDLATDPGEKHDIWRTEPALAAEMRDRYKAASRQIHDVAPTGGIPKHDN